MAYIASITVTMTPLLIAALSGPLSLTHATRSHPLPFLHDLNVLFMFLVSFPILVVCIANDQNVLLSSLRSIRDAGTLTVSDTDLQRLQARWKKRFRLVNYIGQALGVVLGVVVAYFNYIAYIPASVGYWIEANNTLLPAGFALLYCIFLFYYFVPQLIIRTIAVMLLVRELVACSHLRVLPLHPDKGGGLRSVGRLGLRYQYLLTAFGLNVMLMMTIPFYYIHAPATLYSITAAAVIAYLLLGPAVFVVPLIPFHSRMLAKRNELLETVASRLGAEFEHVRAKSEAITKEDADLIKGLQDVANSIEQLPVWPFDASILGRFFIAYIIPLITSSLSVAVSNLIKNYLL